MDLPDSPESMFITGMQGTGKTWLAAAAAWWWSNRYDLIGPAKRYHEWDIMFRTVPSMLSEMRDSFRQDSERSEHQVANRWKRAGLLVMDDLGTEKAGDWSLSLLTELVDSRLAWNKPTIVTSNLGLKQIHEMDPRLASRLGSMKVMKLTGADRRIGGNAS